MDRIGIIGGIGPETTVEYYRRIIALYRRRNPEGSAPYIIINSLDMKKPLDMLTASKLEELATFLSEEVEKLARAGAAFALVAANTPHLVFDAIAQQSRISLISIVEATAEAAKAAGLKRLGLLGTRFTMKASFYPDALAARQIEVVLPNEEEQAYIHGKYMDELVPGIILSETRDRLMNIIKILKDRAQIDGAILGGTELSLILRDETIFGVRILDTTQIHVEAAVARLLGMSANANSDWPTR
ncbi:MAG TPA: amino acid racemase [Candidatus Udaeobacter sp.]|jgi:aspartate racemase